MAEIRIPVENLPPPDKYGDHYFHFRAISVDKNQWSAWSQLYEIKSIGQYRPMESDFTFNSNGKTVDTSWSTPIVYNNSASLSSASISHNHSQEYKSHDTDIYVQWNSGSAMGGFEYQKRVSSDFSSINMPENSYNKVSELQSINNQNDDGFARSVAISSDGKTAVVGAFQDSTGLETYNGAAYIFVLSGSTWIEQQKLLASDFLGNDNFGTSVAISGDGNMVAIGSPNEDTSPNTNQGAVYIFTRSGTTWTQKAKLLGSDAASNDSFGSSVAITNIGVFSGSAILVVGSPNEETSPNTNQGAAYVFIGSDTFWSQSTKLVSLDAQSDDSFGSSVAVSPNGRTILVGAPNEDTSPNTNQGAVYAFPYITANSLTTWQQQQKIISLDPEPDDNFGNSVAISGDGVTVVVGAVGKKNAYVFILSGNVWIQQAKLFSTENFLRYNFGSSVDISYDGNTIAVGVFVTGISSGGFYTLGIGTVNAPTSPDSGACHIFTRLNSDWNQKFRIVPSTGDNDNFGKFVSISKDGSTLLLGTPTEPYSENDSCDIYNLSIINKARVIGTVAIKNIPIVPTFNDPDLTGDYALRVKEFLFGDSNISVPENAQEGSVYDLFKIFDTGINNV